MTNQLRSETSQAGKRWLRIRVTAPCFLADLISSFLCGITGQGTEQTESSEDQEIITAYTVESAEAEKQRLQIKQFLTQLQETLPADQKLTISFSSLRDEDWNRKWKEHFKPEHITSRLVIKPTWESYSPASGEKIIEMDPGMAFGTGHHASTRLSVQFIDQLLQSPMHPKTVLDVGTGTGILAMAAVLLGAHSALAIDNDPEAVAVAAENIRRNKLRIKLKQAAPRFKMSSAVSIWSWPTLSTIRFSSLPPLSLIKWKSDGHLILAGILAGEQEKGIADAYTDLGLRHLATRQEGEWVSLLFIDNLIR